jgi:predicted ester cyclase
MSNEERKAVARLAEQAINQKDLGLLDGHPGYWQTRQVFAGLFTAFPDLSSTVEQQTVDGEWVTTRVTMRGTHLGEFMGIAPTGKTIQNTNISLDKVVDGRVVEHLGVTDTIPLLLAAGLATTPVVPATTPAR